MVASAFLSLPHAEKQVVKNGISGEIELRKPTSKHMGPIAQGSLQCQTEMMPHLSQDGPEREQVSDEKNAADSPVGLDEVHAESVFLRFAG